MVQQDTPARRLERIGAQLRERGARDLADEIEDVIEELRDQAASAEEPVLPRERLLTTGEAAELLGIRSVNTIKKWAIDGLLEGRRLGNRILITRESVDRLLRQPLVSDERKHEQEEESAWGPFDVGDQPVPSSAPWSGRKPWEGHAGGV
jgi:excisionase family DNA binding protein